LSPGPDELPLLPPERSLPTPGVLAGLSALLGLILFSTLGFVSQALNVGFGLWFTEVFIFLAVPWVLLRASGRDPAAYAGMRQPSWRPAAFGFLLGTVNFFAVVVPLQFVAQSLSPQWLRDVFDSSQIFKNQTSVELLLIASGVGVAAPVAEELFFRGVVQRGLMPPNFRPMRAVLVTAVIFSAFHMDPIGFLARAELGVLFGYLFLRTGSLWPGVAAHAANNLVSTLLYFAVKDMGGKEPEPQAAQILLLASCGVAVLAGLLWLPQRFASLLPERALGEAPSTSPPPSLAKAVLPWFAGAAASVALLVGVDSRGVALNYYDVRYQLPSLKKATTPEQKQQRDELDQLRRRARGGEVPVSDYAERRRALLPKGTGTSSPSTPAPPSPQ
jgi:membrane protease YdiL (CAAX protease family)